MFNKKSIKILSIVLMVMLVLMTMGGSVFAGEGDAATTTTGITIPDAKQPTDTTKIDDLGSKLGNVMWLLQWGGIMAAVIIAMFVGIKYITSSPEGKAEVKKTLTIYIAGIVLLLSASTIVGFIYNTLK